MTHVYKLLILTVLMSPCLPAAAQFSTEESKALAALSEFQATSMYMQFDDVKGESTVQGYEEWIELFAFSHAMSIDVILGGGGAGAPRHEPVVVTKILDKATPILMQRLNIGMEHPLVVIEFVADATKPFLYLRYELEDVFLTSYSISAGGDRPIEAVSMVYTKITMTYWPQNQDGSAGDPVVFSWNVATNTSNSAEVVSLDYYVEGQDVVFKWGTPVETGNYGFEIQHLEDDGFRRAAYIPGAGWSSRPLSYEVRISGLDEGIHVFRLASLGIGGSVRYSHEMRVSLGVPEGVDLALDEPYPNPFAELTNIAVSSDREERGRISVFDVLGREVAVVFDGTLEPGSKQRFVFEPADDLPVGLYFIRAKTNRSVQTKAVTVLR